MNTYLIYGIILVILLILELLYFTIADKFDIIDKPNERSSHSSIVRRGGGIIFLLGAWIWSIFFGFQYPFFLAAVTLAAGISFIDDIHSLPDSARLIVQFAAMGLLVWQLFIMAGNNSFIQTSDLWIKIGFIAMALVVCVGATNIYNFMDGINGITACYSAAVQIPCWKCHCPIAFSLRNRRSSRFFYGAPPHGFHHGHQLHCLPLHICIGNGRSAARPGSPRPR